MAIDNFDAQSKKQFNIFDYVFSLEEQIKVLQQEKNKATEHEQELFRLRQEVRDLKQMPLVVGELQAIPVKDKAVVKNANGMEFLVNIPLELQPELEIGDKVAMAQRSLAILEKLPQANDPKALAFEVITKPTVSFKDIGGLDAVRVELEETVALPLKYPERFKKLGIEAPRGVLLHGEPGTGKTLLAKAVANETNATFIHLTGSELVKKYIGEGAKLVKNVFKVAREKAPSILFIDEIDAVAATRIDLGTGGDREVQRTLMQLLAEIDGFHDLQHVKLIAATNRIDILDAAVLRPGRFDRIIEVPLPDKKAREAIFTIHMKPLKLDKGVDAKLLAENTEGFNGADIKSICMEAGIFALRENKSVITFNNFEEAIKKLENKTQEEAFDGRMSA